MANKKISELTELTGVVDANDVLPIVDQTDTTTKKVRYSTLKDQLETDLNIGLYVQNNKICMEV